MEELTNVGVKNRLSFFAKPNNIIFLIVTLALIIRIYLFIKAGQQTLWWDEAEYGAMAKYFIGSLEGMRLNPQRPFLFPGIISLLLLVGSSELVIKILLTLLPSVFLVFCVFFLGKKMFNAKIAIVASFFAAVSWSWLFWSSRLQPDFLSVIFQVLSIAFMWQYLHSPKRKDIVLSAVFSGLAFQFKVSGLLVPATFFIFLLIYERGNLFIKKDYWIFLAVFLVTLLPQFVYSQFAFGSPISFITNSGYAEAVVVEPNPIGWYNLEFLYTLSQLPLFLLFLIGLATSLGFLLYPDLMVKDKSKCLNPNLFSILLIIVVSAFYIFYIRGTEDRWVFIWLPFIFYFAAKPIERLFNYTKENLSLGKIAAIFILVLIAFLQIQHSYSLVKDKSSSYTEVKDAALWIKSHSEKDDLIITQSQTQMMYYAERRVDHFTEAKNYSDFDELFHKLNPKFVTISSVYENHPQWAFDWVANNAGILVPQKVYYADAAHTQAYFVVYEVKDAAN